MCCFFFSSRRRHTRLQGDWSSDVCSSDLNAAAAIRSRNQSLRDDVSKSLCEPGSYYRSEERRVGKECRFRWATQHENKKKKVGRTLVLVVKNVRTGLSLYWYDLMM